MTDDLISRQQAIDALYNVDEYNSRSVTAIKNLPSVQSEQRWIPVNEKLPDKNGYYLATIDIGLKVVDIIYFNTTSGFGFFMTDMVTAWKPHPEPYHGSKADIRSEEYD